MTVESPDMKILAPFFLVAAIAAGHAPAPSAADSGSTEAPVKWTVTVAPAPVAAGGDGAATVTLVPKAGIKLNKYPKIKLQIPASAGLIDAAEGSMGNAAPPSADNLDANYYHGEVEPLTIKFHVDAGAAPGRHDVSAKLSYFYCVAASGYCAPAKVAVSIPVTVR
jgi:hypothetical protein